MVEEPKKKMSIHEKGGPFDDNLTIYEIERAFHPRSKESIKEELTDLMDDFLTKHYNKAEGSIKDADAAVDGFLEMLAKYHFGDAYEAVKGDPKHVAQILKDRYGISRSAMKKAFQRKGFYKDKDSFYASHRDPLIDKVDEDKKRGAQESLNTYLSLPETREEIPEHLKKRTGGKELSDDYKKTLDLETTTNLIASYMSLPGAVEKIEKDAKASLDMPEAAAGTPQLSHAFDQGDKYRKVYDEEAKKVDRAHRFKKKEEKKPA